MKHILNKYIKHSREINKIGKQLLSQPEKIHLFDKLIRKMNRDWEKEGIVIKTVLMNCKKKKA